MAITRSFAEMQECLGQYAAGLITDYELILALQCDVHQLTAIRMMMDLPFNAAAKLRMSDFDESVESERAKSLVPSPVASPQEVLASCEPVAATSWPDGEDGSTTPPSRTLPFLTPDDWEELNGKCLALKKVGKTQEAFKLYRSKAGCSLSEARHAVEKL